MAAIEDIFKSMFYKITKPFVFNRVVVMLILPRARKDCDEWNIWDLLSLFSTSRSTTCSAILSDQNLFPFGFSEGDMTIPRSLFGRSPRIDLCTPFPFFGKSETTLFVSSNTLHQLSCRKGAAGIITHTFSLLY